jgi:hypothetical protein
MRLARSPIPTFFRPFGQGGNLDDRLLNPVVVDALTVERMSCVLWNAIPGDWKEPDGWVDRALAQLRAWTVMVLHDLPTGAMRNLERFLDAAADLGVRLRQDFAPECVPILDGRIVRPIADILSPTSVVLSVRGWSAWGNELGSPSSYILAQCRHGSRVAGVAYQYRRPA